MKKTKFYAVSTAIVLVGVCGFRYAGISAKQCANSSVMLEYNIEA